MCASNVFCQFFCRVGASGDLVAAVPGGIMAIPTSNVCICKSSCSTSQPPAMFEQSSPPRSVSSNRTPWFRTNCVTKGFRGSPSRSSSAKSGEVSRVFIITRSTRRRSAIGMKLGWDVCSTSSHLAKTKCRNNVQQSGTTLLSSSCCAVSVTSEAARKCLSNTVAVLLSISQ